MTTPTNLSMTGSQSSINDSCVWCFNANPALRRIHVVARISNESRAVNIVVAKLFTVAKRRVASAKASTAPRRVDEDEDIVAKSVVTEDFVVANDTHWCRQGECLIL